ncbi:hypothetical protein Tco_1361358 [Tanacetum coccineum]
MGNSCQTLEESGVKMKEKQFQVNYENINSLYDTSEKSDVPPRKMPNERKLLKLFVTLDNEISKLENFNINLNTDKHGTVFYDDRAGIKRLFTHGVFLISDSLKECSTVIKQDITEESYVKIKNREEIERFSKESKDVDKLCNDVVEVKEKLSK